MARFNFENEWKYNSYSDFEFVLFKIVLSARKYPLMFKEQLIIRITLLNFKLNIYLTRSTLNF